MPDMSEREIPHRKAPLSAQSARHGYGTVGMVAERLGRRWIGCELNDGYCDLIAGRTAQAGLPFGGGDE
jgi:hypothetical protein